MQSMKKQLTAAQIAARDERRAKFRGLCKQIANMGETERLILAAKMPGVVTCEGHALSLHNCCLLALQCPSATIVGGFKQWQRQGRAVTKGEHGHMIWVPTGAPKLGERSEPAALVEPGANGSSEPSEHHFIMATIFDVSQTHEIETTQPEPSTVGELIAA